MEAEKISYFLEDAKRKANEKIEAYKEELKDVYKNGLTDQDGLMCMFRYFNLIIPANFRSKLSFQDCQEFNSYVIFLLRNLNQ